MRTSLTSPRAILAAACVFCTPGVAAAHPAHHHDAEPRDPYAEARDSLSGDAQTTYDDLLADLRSDPDDADAATVFARFAGQEGRRLGDDALTAAARLSLAPWADEADADPGLLTVRASLRQYDHEFADAEADLTRVLEARPRDAQALLSRAFVRAVTGDYLGARDDCVDLDMRVPPLVRETCLARAASLTGEAETAQRRLALAVGRSADAPDQLMVFALGVLGDIAVRNDDPASAKGAYERALALDPASVFVRANLADLLIDQGAIDEAARLLEGASDTEALLLAKARLTGAEGDAARTLRQRMRDDLAADDYRHAREHGRFALDVLGDEKLALRLAEENWRMQREPIDAVLLVRAAEAAGEPSRAAPALRFAQDQGLTDARLTAAAAALP